MSADRPRTPPTLALAVGARRFLRAPARVWRRSIRVRTVLVTLLLSSIALLAVGTVVSYTIAQGLFQDRVKQVLAESARATDSAQGIIDTPNDSAVVEAVRIQAITGVSQVARPDAYWWERGPQDGGGPLAPIGTDTGAETLIEPGLRTQMAKDPVQHWQSIALPVAGDQVDPGIVVGNVLQIAGGPSELYLVYDIHDVQDTLTVVQRALLVGGIALLVLIAAVTAVVTSLVVRPLRQAAATSEQLAEGHLERRIPVRGDDVTATLARSFNRMAENLQRQITQLGNLSRVQQRFVSDVSHELRTPLTTIRLASDVLYGSRERYDAPSARSAELLKAQVERFEALLADLLEISRMDAHAAELSGEPTNLVDLVREGIDSLGGLAADMETEVVLIAPGGHAAVELDARRIARIIRNLLANAIEHGESHPITVTVDSSETAVAVGVRDHGIGMSSGDAARVFDRFWRADPSRQRRIGGTGLGLAISLEDAQLHGGALEVWTRKGEGTNFVLTLPRGSGVLDLDRPVPVRPLDAAPDPEPRQKSRRVPARVGS